MADFNSSLPVRTENAGDIIAKLADATTPTQQLAIDAAGLIGAKTYDGAGTAITSTLVSGKQGLDVNVISAITVGVTDESAFTYGTSSEVTIGGVFQDTSPSVSAGVTAAARITSFRALHMNLRDSSGNELLGQKAMAASIPVVIASNQSAISVTATNFPATVDTNYGTVGASTLRSAAQIGNATGAADFNFGAASAQTLRVAALVGNAAGVADFNFGAASAQTLRAAALIGNATGAADFNFGTVGAQTLRAAAQIGNATGAADFNSGATGAQTLRTVANQGAPNSAANAWPISVTSGGALNSPSNPLYVSEVDTVGSPVDDFKDASAIAANASDNHDYTVTAGKTLYLKSLNSSASGKAKMQVQVETGVATNVFTNLFVQFNSTSDTNMLVKVESNRTVAAGVRVRVIMTNLDKASQDLYSTISGVEI